MSWLICALNLEYLSCRARGNSTARGRCRCNDLATGVGDCLKCVYAEADYRPLRLDRCLVRFNIYDCLVNVYADMMPEKRLRNKKAWLFGQC